VLAARTDRLVAVSEEVRDELVDMGIAPAQRFEVIRLGFDLSPFAISEPERARRGAALRRELGMAPDARIVTLIARLVPIKRVDRYLRIAVRLAEMEHVDAGSRRIHFLVVGGGELQDALLDSEQARVLGKRLSWAGFRRDIPDVCFASDVVVLTSDNEGTPVSLIEALASGTPAVSTDVGGVRTVIRHEETGLLAAPEDEAGFAAAVKRLLDQPELAATLARRGRQHALEQFTQERLVDAIDLLYRDLLGHGDARSAR
jgi:glycosyltransferase involved in cell wall biosynthesis